MNGNLHQTVPTSTVNVLHWLKEAKEKPFSRPSTPPLDWSLSDSERAIVAEYNRCFADSRQLRPILLVQWVRSYVYDTFRNDPDAVSKAEAVLRECLDWRQSLDVVNLPFRSLPRRKEWDSLWPTTFAGYQHQGFPVYLINLPQASLLDGFTTEEARLYHVQRMETIERRKEQHWADTGDLVYRHIVLTDLATPGVSPDLKALWRWGEAIDTLQSGLSMHLNFYPDTLHELYVLNTPWFARMLWQLLRGFLPEATARKFKLLGKEYLDELLKEGFTTALIPLYLGGHAPNPNGIQMRLDIRAGKSETLRVTLQSQNPDHLYTRWKFTVAAGGPASLRVEVGKKPPQYDLHTDSHTEEIAGTAVIEQCKVHTDSSGFYTMEAADHGTLQEIYLIFVLRSAVDENTLVLCEVESVNLADGKASKVAKYADTLESFPLDETCSAEDDPFGVVWNSISNMMSVF
ncbi:hypothetical protein CYMTET_48457 [Cymbomonas tetramitiformis]|uniref:CRAL-TRIO domain-containing protein n=1 Tax=Cymbomonas tetramitiformis TaxID=36881 RepID=A0AAE0BU44_9CHLO|nr:hypothetical protein CYMTET_48457 [Cymbomonas tetramitiformis]|eukprot:gene355-661_t